MQSKAVKNGKKKGQKQSTEVKTLLEKKKNNNVKNGQKWSRQTKTVQNGQKQKKKNK